MLNHLNVRNGMFSARQFDTFSNALLTNHNLWVHLDAFKTANDLIANDEFMHVPQDYLNCIELIGELFSETTFSGWTDKLERHKDFLDSLAPYRL